MKKIKENEEGCVLASGIYIYKIEAMRCSGYSDQPGDYDKCFVVLNTGAKIELDGARELKNAEAIFGNKKRYKLVLVESQTEAT